VLVLASCGAALLYQRLVERPALALSRSLRVADASEVARRHTRMLELGVGDYGIGS